MDFSKVDILIGSYLGMADEEVQKKRYKIHRQQREILDQMFPTLHIRTLATQWPKWAKDDAFFKDNETRHQKKPTYKYEDHQKVLHQIYGMENKAILLLDDDTVPYILDDLPESKKVVPTITKWLLNPATMPASLIYFSNHGLIQDIYYKSRDPVLGTCPVFPAGWATLVRSDLGVTLKEEDVWYKDVQVGEDTVFRTKAAAAGKEVLKHFGLFFHTFQNKSNDKGSAWYRGSREARRLCIQRSREWMVDKYPWLYRQQGKRIVPIWNVKGREHRTLVMMGGLKRSKYGFVPVPSVLQSYHMRKKQGRASLLDLL